MQHREVQSLLVEGGVQGALGSSGRDQLKFRDVLMPALGGRGGGGLPPSCPRYLFSIRMPSITPLIDRDTGKVERCLLEHWQPVAAGIYGPGEQRHLPRVVRAVEMGLFKFVYGSPSTLVDFVHVSTSMPALPAG